jgi:hypothetical protein
MIVALMLALLSAADGPATVSARHSCQCKDLPKLFEELMEQEKLRDVCQEYAKMDKVNDEFLSIGEVSERLSWRLSEFIAQRGAARSGAGQAGTKPAGGAAPAYGTDFLHEGCGLMKYPPKDANGKQPDPVPSSPEEVQAQECSQIADYLLEHEKYHQDRCRERFAKGVDPGLILIPSNYLKEDCAAYDQGIRRLRAGIAQLSRNTCGWQGSTKKFKKGGFPVVPTPEQIGQLKDVVDRQAKALGKGAAK